MLILLLIISYFFLSISGAYAYIGPGLGLGAIGAFLGVVFAVFLAIVGVVWYPIKRMIKKSKAHKDIKNEKNTEK